MADHRVSHDLEADPTVYDSHLDEPLEFEDGTATVADEATARNVARRHTHLEYAGRVQGEADDEAFDADSFVDRTPMDDVVEDIESGDYDEHLEAIKESADRQGVTDAIEARRSEQEG